MKGKKADVEIQFNWILILIVGAIILGFFVFVVNKQKQVSDRKLATDLLSDMDLIIVGQGVSAGSSKTLELSELELKFTCEDYSIMDVPKTMGNSIIFSPSDIKSATLLTFTKSWDVPFKAANFVYITAPDIKYYLLGGQIATDLKSGIPEKIDVEVTGKLPDNPQGYQHIRIVYFTEPPAGSAPVPAGLQGFDDDQVSALYIPATEIKDLEGTAMMSFYKKKGSDFVKDGDGEFAAFGKESVIGAIMTTSYEIYRCNMMKALKRLEIVATVYKQREESLLAGMQGDPCMPYYQPSDLEDIISSIRNPDNTINPPNIFIAAKNIEAMNEKTIFASCPEIY